MKFPNYYFKHRKRPGYLIFKLSNGVKNLFDKSKSQLKAIREVTPVEAWATTVYSNENVMNMLKANATYKISYDYECINVPIGLTLDNSSVGFLFYSGINDAIYPQITMMKSQQLAIGDKGHYEKIFITPETFHDTGNNYQMLCYGNRYVDENDNTHPCSVIFRNIRIVEV